MQTLPPPLPSPVPPPLPAQRRRGFKWWHGLLILVGLLGTTCVGGLFYIGVAGAESYVTEGRAVSPWHKKTLRKAVGLATNETIRFFYSAALIDVASEGELLTDRAVYSWMNDDGFELLRAEFNEISDVELERGESFFDDSVVTVTLTNNECIYLILPIERNGDEMFVKALKKSVKDAQRKKP